MADVCVVCRSSEGVVANHSAHYERCACRNTLFHAICWNAYRTTNRSCATCRSPALDAPLRVPTEFTDTWMFVAQLAYVTVLFALAFAGIVTTMEVNVVVVCIWAIMPIFVIVAIDAVMSIVLRERLFALRRFKVGLVYAFIVHLICFSADVHLRTVQSPFYFAVNVALVAHFALFCALVGASMIVAACWAIWRFVQRALQ